MPGSGLSAGSGLFFATYFMSTLAYRVRPADFADPADAAAAREVRRVVFVIEQGVPESLEIDGRDAGAVHALAFADDGSAIGTARLLPGGKIGRVAVLAPWRGRGVGAALMRCLLDAADAHGWDEIVLHAQSWTVGFYEKLGFVIEGDEFEEAKIPHRRMVRRRGGICGS